MLVRDTWWVARQAAQDRADIRREPHGVWALPDGHWSVNMLPERATVPRPEELCAIVQPSDN